jgi:hypothetical protein
MPKNRRVYTFLIIPTSTSRVTRLNIPVKLFYIVGAVLGVLLLTSLLGAARWARNEALNLKYQSLRAENERLKNENDVFQNRYSKLKGQLSFIQDESKQLARQAKMEPAADVDAQVGPVDPKRWLPWTDRPIYWSTRSALSVTACEWTSYVSLPFRLVCRSRGT